MAAQIMNSRLLIALLAVGVSGSPSCDARSGGAPEGSGGTAPPAGAGSGGRAAPGGTGGHGDIDGTGGTAPLGSGGGPLPGSGGSLASGAGGSATGATGGTTSDPPADGALACAALARALCARGEACAPFATSLVFGTRVVCEERLQLDCLARFAPGSSATPADTMACADSLASQSCAAFARGDLGSACTPRPGSLTTGATCLDDRQCDSAFCARAPDAACGACAPPTAPGSPCVRGSCSAGAVCPKGTSTCVTPAPGPIGAVCTVSEQCDVGNGVACNPLTQRCIRLALPSTGACGLDVATSTYNACSASASCTPLLAGKCVAAAADGAACSTAEAGPPCLPPARCVGGRCSLPDPSACAP